jgi:hypothetical protein
MERPSGTTTMPAPQPIQHNPGRATKVNIIDNEAALKAEAVADEIFKAEATPAERAKMPRRQKGNAASSAAKGAGTKSRFALNSDGEVRWRKKCESVVGEKRKRVDVLEQPNKRPAVEGRSFAPLRVSRFTHYCS